MTTTLTNGIAVKCSDQAGNTINGIIVEIMPGNCRGGGLAMVKAVWPGRSRASVRDIELADVEVTA